MGENAAPSGGLAIVTGAGDLPRLLAEEAGRQGREVRLLLFGGFRPDWITTEKTIEVEYERPGRMFRSLRALGIREVVFAGAMRRPSIRFHRFDLTMLKAAPRLLSAVNKGDDVTLTAITGFFESQDFRIVAAHEILKGLLAPEGVLGHLQPDEQARKDAVRAAEIVAALGQVDVGQGAVVAKGICLGVEAIEGTDAMLSRIAEGRNSWLPSLSGRSGLLMKAPKPGQDWRTDLPAIGPGTMKSAAEAGLSGIVVQAGGVLILGLAETIEAADKAGLFLWARPADPPDV